MEPPQGHGGASGGEAGGWPSIGGGSGFPPDGDPSGEGWHAPEQASGEQPGLGSGGWVPPQKPSRRGRKTVFGVVRGIQTGGEFSAVAGADLSVLTFRIDQFDNGGNLIGQVPVQMRGRAIQGVLRDGDHVVAEGRWRDGVLQSNRVSVYYGGSIVGVVRPKPPVALWQVVLAVVIVLAFAGFAYAGYRNFNNQPQGPKHPKGKGVPADVRSSSKSHSTTTSPSATTESPSPSIATVAEIGCSPSEVAPKVTVQVGDQARWVNKSDSEAMGLTFNNPPPGFANQTIAPGETYEFAFTEKGSYEYVCVFSVSQVKRVGTVSVVTP